MCKFNPKNDGRRIDLCMREFMVSLDCFIDHRAKVVACCCGHKKYPMTIVVKDEDNAHFELVSGVYIQRKKKFYKKDKQGHYYIPETL